MALQTATIIDNGKVIGGIEPDLTSAIGYSETVGTACKNPDGYTKGSCFVNTTDGFLYEATAAIASGATLTAGTNCKKTDVCTKLSELNSELTWKTWKTNEPTDASTNVALPSSFKELLIDVKGGSPDYIVGNFYVNAKRLSTTETLYRSGYYETSQYNGEAIVWVSTTTARGRVLENNAQSRTTTLDIYYR